MPRIDIIGTRQPAGGHWLAWLAVIGFSVWLVSRRESSPVIPVDPARPDAIVLVPPVGMAGSTLVDDWGKRNGIEVRRYQEGENLKTAEPWVQELYDLSDGERPCAVVAIGSDVEIVPITDNLLEHLQVIASD